MQTRQKSEKQTKMQNVVAHISSNSIAAAQ